MAELPDIDTLTEGLDQQARAVVALMHGMLTSMMAQLDATSERLEGIIEKLQAENAELKRMLFGQRSERRVMPSVKREAAKRARAAETDEEKTRREAAAKKRREARKQARKELPTVDERLLVPEDAKACPSCGGDFRALGEGLVTEQYEYVPARLVRKRHVREKLVCRCGDTLLTAPPPAQVTEGAEYGPGLHARVAVAKCADSMPLHRQAKELKRSGAEISRSTLGDLFHRSAEILQPLHARLVEIVAACEHVNADETPLWILAPEKCRRGYVWTFLANGVVTYVYSASRAGETAVRVLGDSQGVLQVDGYSGYNKVTTPNRRIRSSCWGHGRRYFFKALPTAPEAEEVMDLIADLYAIEYVAQEKGICGTEAHRVLRDTESRRIVEKIEAWVDEHLPITRPQSPLGAALTYMHGQREALRVYLDDPKVGIDNNISERALRIVALGRKNFLFAGHDGAADNLAVLQTLVSTCEAQGVNPQDYLTDVLVRIQTHPQSRIDELLPQNWQPPDDAGSAGV